MTGLSSNGRIRIVLEFLGGGTARAEMKKQQAYLDSFGGSIYKVNKQMEVANKRSWAWTQTLYTLRRYAFYGTLAITAMGAALFALGYKFYSALSTSRVAFKGILGSTKAANAELKTLYLLAARTPFEFPDLVTATRRILPFAKNVGLTNDVVEALTNSLSGMGLITPAAIQRASLAMSHLFSVGRLTGQILYQLGRDNIPMLQALEKHFHATGLQIKQMVTAGLIDATTAAKALINLTKTSPEFKNQAFLQATQTLPGAISTLKDLIGMSVGSASGGIFEGLRKSIQGIDKGLIGIAKSGGAITLTQLVRAIDAKVSPNLHIVLNTFILLSATLKTIITLFGALFYALDKILWPAGKISHLFGANEKASKLLGIALGILITNWLALKTVTVSWHIAKDLRDFIFSGSKIKETAKFMWGLVTATQAQAAATYEWATAQFLVLATNPLTWIIAGGILLTVLYFKWKRFHDLVNETFNYFLHNSGAVAAALRAAFAPIYSILAAVELLIKKWTELKHSIGGSLYAQTLNQGVTPGFGGNKHGGGFKWSDFWSFPSLGFGGGHHATTTTAAPAVVPLSHAALGSMSGVVTVKVYPQPIHLNGKKIAEAQAQAVTDVEARQ